MIRQLSPAKKVYHYSNRTPNQVDTPTNYSNKIPNQVDTPSNYQQGPVTYKYEHHSPSKVVHHVQANDKLTDDISNLYKKNQSSGYTTTTTTTSYQTQTPKTTTTSYQHQQP